MELENCNHCISN